MSQESKNSLAIQDLICEGGIIINPQNGHGLFTIKIGETEEDARVFERMMESTNTSTQDIISLFGIGLGKGRQKKGETDDETALREIYEELGVTADELKKMGYLGRYMKIRKYYTKFVAMNRYLLLDQEKEYVPTDSRHKVVSMDLYTALKYIKSPEEKRFLEKHIDSITRQIKEIQKNAGIYEPTNKITEQIF